MLYLLSHGDGLLFTTIICGIIHLVLVIINCVFTCSLCLFTLTPRYLSSVAISCFVISRFICYYSLEYCCSNSFTSTVGQLFHCSSFYSFEIY